MYIYKTTNLINGKIYVGKTIKDNIEYLGSGLILNRAIEKYGKENFKKEVIEVCSSIMELNDREIYWIKNLNALDKKIGYNVAKGGSGGDTYSHNTNLPDIKKKFIGSNNPMFGKKMIDVFKKKYGEVEGVIKYQESIDNRKGRNAWNKGKRGIYSSETLEKISNNNKGKTAWNKGKKLTQKQKSNMGTTRKGKKIVNNGIEHKFIDLSELNYYISKGYILGRIKQKGVK